ncbi:bifunctional diguanylate cyclase/phosphodiesterase [Methylobacterium sp. WSM2598]|uniref:bifunctional diguanylate cyclase/phosphodiesterase n=1 Tax=Methylobacterium sp. WSM2598 TaxID=398261 RepID=UPI00037C0900|nr:EAL domain-containing protein [Methylobacterium sp. WSM2598]
MMDIIACLTQQHDPRLIVVAALICAVGCYATFALGRQTFRASGRERIGWAAAAVLTTSSAIWATHFIAMLAFAPGMAFGFALAPTVASFAVAVMLVSLAALAIVGSRTRHGAVAGGAIIGLAIAGMHYTGMAAYRVQGTIAWDGQRVAVSVLAGIALSVLALRLSLAPQRLARALAPLALLLAVCGAHFIGMGALSLRYDPRIALPDGSLDAAVVTILTANAAFLILGAALAALRLSILNHRRRVAERQRLRDLADIAVEGLLICDDDAIVGVNRSIERILGRGREEVIGRALPDLLPGLSAAAIPLTHERDATLRDASGAEIPVRVIAQTIAIETRPHLVVAVRDQRDRLRAEAAITHLAHHDALTGLANRLRFNGVLAELLAERFAARRHDPAPFALLILDLDRFKAVNDTLGHGMGDDLLRRVAQRLLRVVGAADVVARLGGDEFAILLAGAGDAAGAGDLAAIQAAAERAIEILSRPFVIDGHILDIGASIGIALAPQDGDTPEQLLRSADLALYGAKEEGRGRFRMFEGTMNARMQARRSLELDLRRALARQEFELYFQPQVDARTGRFDGAEALIRWHHPERGLVSPGEFIPLAEETGLIGPLGEWVLRTACAEARRWATPLPVAVNLSPVQFRDPRLAATVRGILAETGLPGSRLEIEITEGTLMQDEHRTLAVLTELRCLGIRISMDDFGTGYSSLSYLRRFPFDKIKIDQSFVRQTPQDRDSVAIVRAIAMLGRSLGIKTTAEGVETDQQSVFIAGEGCDQLQGYLYSRPVPAESIAELFRAPRAARA